MKFMYPAVFRKNEDGTYNGYFPDLECCTSTGDTLDEAIELILAKREAEAKKHIKKFDEDAEMEILNGRYGPYIAYKGNNYKIPKDVVPVDLNYQTCLEIIKLQSEKAENAPKNHAIFRQIDPSYN